MDDASARVFARCEPGALAVAEGLLAGLKALPDVSIDPKATCLHVKRRTAFAGLHPRRDAVLLNLRTAEPIQSPRIRKTERVSAHRWHNELLVDSIAALDAELAAWIAEAHALAS
jgi:hypothetical protein